MNIEQFQKYQEETFDAFCKAVMRNECIEAHRELAARAEREIQLSVLSESELAGHFTEDTYHPYCKSYVVQGNIVKIHNPALGEILASLSPQRRDIVLLHYYLDYSDAEIAKILKISNDAVRIRKRSTLRRLRELLEGIDDE